MGQLMGGLDGPFLSHERGRLGDNNGWQGLPCHPASAPRMLMAELGLAVAEAPQHIHKELKMVCGQNPDEVIAKQTRFFKAPANPPRRTASFLASLLQRSGG